MNAPRLMDQLIAAIRGRHDSIKTERAHWGWIRRFIRFHGMCHPRLTERWNDGLLLRAESALRVLRA